MCYISMCSQDYRLRAGGMSSLSLQVVLQQLRGVGKVLSENTFVTN